MTKMTENQVVRHTSHFRSKRKEKNKTEEHYNGEAKRYMTVMLAARNSKCRRKTVVSNGITL